MFQQALTFWNDETLWEHLTPMETVSSDILRFTARPCAAVYYNVVVPFRGFPLMLLRLLHEPHLADTMLGLGTGHPCLTDNFTKSFLASFPTADALTSAPALAQLRALGALGLANAFDTEKIHSSNARLARSRTHTHVAPLVDLAVWKQGWAAPNFAKNDSQDRKKEKTLDL